jgi:hypothetical protein
MQRALARDALSALLASVEANYYNNLHIVNQFSLLNQKNNQVFLDIAWEIWQMVELLINNVTYVNFRYHCL